MAKLEDILALEEFAKKYPYIKECKTADEVEEYTKKVPGLRPALLNFLTDFEAGNED